MLRVDALRAGYGGGTVLHGITLTVATGAVHAVVGHNGTGKSTLLHTIAGLIRPTAGRMCLGDRDLTGQPAHRIARAGVALVPQGRRVFASLTVAEHLTLTRRGIKHPGSGWPVDRILALFPQLGHRLAHRGGQLSGGEQQMLAIARALRAQPWLLLLDEPTEGLAPTLARQVRDVIGMLAADGLGILLATPNLPLAMAVADHLVVLAAGRVVADLDADTARTDPARLVDLLAPTTPAVTPGHGPAVTVRPCSRPAPSLVDTANPDASTPPTGGTQ